MQKLLGQMYANLSESLSDKADIYKRREIYENQLTFYEKIFSGEKSEQEREKALVCARCFISISRALAENSYSAKSLEEARCELEPISRAFQKRGVISERLRGIAEERINSLSRKTPDEISDSVLFLYLSLMQL